MTSRRPRFARGTFLFLIACAALDAPLACAPASDTGAAPTGRAASSIVGGKDSDEAQDPVVLVTYSENGFLLGTCTGTLLAPDLVLTARHCVADADLELSCDESGRATQGGAVHASHAPASLAVFVGADRQTFSATGQPAGHGLAILDDGADNLCNHDIALIVLDAKIAHAKIAPIRLDGPVLASEPLTTVGWGVTETSVLPLHRQQRAGVKVLGIGPGTFGISISPNEFLVDQSVCEGDSGGPAFAPSKAIVGTVSRGVATNAAAATQAEKCVGGLNVFTKISPFRDLLLRGFARVGAAPVLEEVPVPPLADDGSACSKDADCRSGVCLTAEDGSKTCARSCAADACPDGLVCTADADASVCLPPAPLPGTEAPPPARTVTTSGCSAARGASSADASGPVAASLVLLAVLAAARRRGARIAAATTNRAGRP